MSKLAYWSSEHRRWVVALWIVVLVGAMGISRVVGSHYSTNFNLPKTDSQRAMNLLSSGFRAQSGDSDQIVLHALGGTLAAPATRVRVERMLARVAHLPHVASVVSPYAPGTGALSRDGTIGFATVTFDQRANNIPVPAIKRVMSTAEQARSAGCRSSSAGRRSSRRSSARSAHDAGRVGAAVVVLLDQLRLAAGDGPADRDRAVRARHRHRPDRAHPPVIEHAGHLLAAGADDRARRRDRLRALHRHPLPRGLPRQRRPVQPASSRRWTPPDAP